MSVGALAKQGGAKCTAPRQIPRAQRGTDHGDVAPKGVRSMGLNRDWKNRTWEVRSSGTVGIAGG